MKRLTILIDLDSIVIDLLRPWLNFYNRTHDDNITIDDLTTYNIENHAKKLKKTNDLYKFFADPKNYSSCPVLPGASEGLSALERDGHDVIIATATAGRTAHIKWDLVHKAAPWLHSNNIMVGARKEKLHGDVLIDDAPKNIASYRFAWPTAHILTIAYPYNEQCKDIVNCRAEGYNDTERAWETMVDYIRNI